MRELVLMTGVIVKSLEQGKAAIGGRIKTMDANVHHIPHQGLCTGRDTGQQDHHCVDVTCDGLSYQSVNGICG